MNKGKVIELVDREATAEELEKLYVEHPDFKRLLGNEYTVRRDKAGGYYVIDGSGEVELGVGLFLAISKMIKGQ